MKRLLDIGVVIPTHTKRVTNGMTTRAVNSALRQTQQPTAVHIYVDEDRRGAPYARQRALELNSCEWTAFLDSDDHFMPHHLETLAKTAIAQGADYVYSWYELVRLGQRMGETYFTMPDGTQSDGVFPPGHRFDPWDPENPRQTTITMLVRTELAKSIGFWAPDDATTFPDGHRVGEDYHFTLECNRLGKIFHIPDQTWFWEHHGLNSSGRAGRGDA